ncbi:hypothetical protein [Paraburkholderia sp. HP33-1]|uniref:hypothetical protein n=1 Tax=Paraburkholderia sp. HP33-1 TaxID=2883243 RepID=UPI001F3566AF|nr:hypothetical protein [Paraburkholderia sp. HP33-1]
MHPGRITFSFQRLSVSKHFFLIFGDYFSARWTILLLGARCAPGEPAARPRRFAPLYAASDR